MKYIYDQFSGMEGMWPQYAKQELLPRLFGFELMISSYSMAHLQLAMFLKETGVDLSERERLQVYLTNSLEEAHSETHTLFSNFLSQESQEASKIKSQNPVMVVLGNPPYSGISNNKSEFRLNLINDYKFVDGKPLNERKHWLNDDYVKFIRYAEHFVEKNEEGVLAYITNHSYLDNPTFRGMRQHLLKTFDKIYILDLHGNSLKKETTPDGDKDENVFDIQAGVSIIFAIKKKDSNTDPAEVYHYDLFGRRYSKYQFLNNNSLGKIEWNVIANKSPYYFFIDKNYENHVEYNIGVKLNELFKYSTTGVVTMGDNFIIDFNSRNLNIKLDNFLMNNYSEDFLKKKFSLGKNYGNFILKNKSDVIFDYEKIQDIHYRPFDKRKIYFDNLLVWRSREKVMNHFIQNKNLGLCFVRQVAENDGYNHILITDSMVDNRYTFSSKGTVNEAPLYISGEDIVPNLNKELVEEIESKLGMSLDWEAGIETSYDREHGERFSPVDLLDYIYAVLHSPSYREKYKEFLKIDFPRVPFDVDRDEFWRLVGIGGELRKLHLMESISDSNLTVTFPAAGEGIVDKPVWKANKVFINDTQYFDHVSELAWNFYIGGYQPARKWLKDRKGRHLNFEDITHYRKICFILEKTDELMNKIDTKNTA